MIHIINDFYVNMDEYNHTLVEKKIAQKGKEKGKETFTTIGYYSSLYSAVEACRRILVARKMVDGVYELSAAIKIMDEQTEELKKLITF